MCMTKKKHFSMTNVFLIRLNETQKFDYILKTKSTILVLENNILHVIELHTESIDCMYIYQWNIPQQT